MDFFSIILIFCVPILMALYYWTKYQMSYWKKTNLPSIPYAIPLIGNFQDMVFFNKCPAEALQEMYSNEKTKNEPVVGINVFHKPGILVKDLDLIKRILVKDFYKFSNRYAATDIHTDAIGGYNLFFLKNPAWKEIRSNLTPIFTTGKIKQMFPLISDIGDELDKHLLALNLNSKTNSICKDVREICALYTTDVIGSIAFGIKAHSLQNPNAEFRKNGKEIFNFTWSRALEWTAFFFIPSIVSTFKCKVFSKKSTEFLRTEFNYILNEREKSGIQRNDLIDTLVTLKRNAKLNPSFSINNLKYDGDILVAQAAIFFTAGFETSSTTMSFGLYELSKNFEIQKRLRNEIKHVLIQNKGEITYDLIQNMEYLNMCVQELLRLYPPLPFLDREYYSNESVKNGGYSLEPFSDFVVPNGMPIYIPSFAIQRDEKLFPNPDLFDPERFSPQNKDNILPYSYLPFGQGPRGCIGERIGLLQVKIGLVNFLRNHYVKPSEKSMKVMRLAKKALTIQPECGIYCDIYRDPLV